MSRGSSSARTHRYRAEATTSASSMWPAASRTDHSEGAGLARSRSPASRKISRRVAGDAAWTSAGSSSPSFPRMSRWYSEGSSTGSGVIATSMSSWLAARYGLGWGTARVWVRVAHALEGLPRIAQAYAAGGLSWDQLRPLTTFATPGTDARWAEAPTGVAVEGGPEAPPGPGP